MLSFGRLGCGAFSQRDALGEIPSVLPLELRTSPAFAYLAVRHVVGGWGLLINCNAPDLSLNFRAELNAPVLALEPDV